MRALRRAHTTEPRLLRGEEFLGGLLILTTFLVGCDQRESPPVEAGPPVGRDSIVAPTPPGEGDLVFDREFLFLSLEEDSLVVVPWFFRAQVTSERVHREQSAWLSRGGSWETLAQEAQDTPSTRAPWRILPGEAIRLIVGPGDRLESLLLRDPPRELETVLGDLMTEWATPGAESVRLYRSRTLFPAGSVDGIAIEISRRWRASNGAHPGDWVFVHAGSQLQFFMEGGRLGGEPGASLRYEGWTRVALRDLRWRDLRVVWDEVAPYEAARRDVPVRWSIGTPDGEVSGYLESVSSHLMVGQGEGPILPLQGLFEVSGLLEVEGEEFAVEGLIRHSQP